MAQNSESPLGTVVAQHTAGPYRAVILIQGKGEIQSWGELSSDRTITSIPPVAVSFILEGAAFARACLHFQCRYKKPETKLFVTATSDVIFDPKTSELLDHKCSDDFPDEASRQDCLKRFGIADDSDRAARAKRGFSDGSLFYARFRYTHGEKHQHVNVFNGCDHGPDTQSIRDLENTLRAQGSCDIEMLFESGRSSNKLYFQPWKRQFEDARAQTSQNLNPLRGYYPRLRGGAPLDRMAIPAMSSEPSQWILPSRERRPLIKLAASDAFSDMDMYLVKRGGVDVSERENAEMASSIRFQARVCIPPESKDTRLLELITEGHPDSDIPLHETKFTVRIMFKEPEVWDAVVCPRVPGLPKEVFWIMTTRCKSGVMRTDSEPSQAVKIVNSTTFPEFKRLMKEAPVLTVLYTPPNLETAFCKIFDQLAALSDHNAKAEPSLQRISKYLTGHGSRLDPLMARGPKFQSFQEVPDQKAMARVLRKRHDLDDEQYAIIKRTALGTRGFTVVQGPPGAGKSRVILAILEMCEYYSPPHEKGKPLPVKANVLITAPSNVLVDDLVRRAAKHFPDRLFVRIHNAESEKKLLEQGRYSEADSARAADTEQLDDRDPSTIKKNKEYGMMIFDMVKKLKERNKNVGDLTVRDEQHTMAAAIMKLTGLIHLDSPFNMVEYFKSGVDQDAKTHYYNFCNYVPVSAAELERMEDEEHKNAMIREAAFSDAIAWFRRFVIERVASGVYCTDNRAGSAQVHGTRNIEVVENGQKKLTRRCWRPLFAVHDESGRESEGNSLCSLVPYRETEHFYLWDPQQLGPFLQKSDKFPHPYESQAEVPLVRRLVRSGTDTFSLTTQHRAEPNLVEVAMQPFYHDMKIKTLLPPGRTERTELAERFIRSLTKREGHACLLDVGSRCTADPKIGTSRSMVGTAAAAHFVLREAIKSGYQPEHVGIITPYRKQLLYHDEELLQVSGAEKVVCNTIDSAQGAEYRLAIIDVPVSSEGARFLDPKRLNVAFSRAQDALVVVMHPRCFDILTSGRSDASTRDALRHIAGKGRVELAPRVIEEEEAKIDEVRKRTEVKSSLQRMKIDKH